MKNLLAFTLVEVVVVVLIIAALAAIVMPRISSSMVATKDEVCRANINNINRQIELYNANTGNWPTAITDVTANPDYFPDGPPKCPYGIAYSLNQTTHRVVQHSHSDSQAQPGSETTDNLSSGNQDNGNHYAFGQTSETKGKGKKK